MKLKPIKKPITIAKLEKLVPRSRDWNVFLLVGAREREIYGWEVTWHRRGTRRFYSAFIAREVAEKWSCVELAARIQHVRRMLLELGGEKL